VGEEGGGRKWREEGKERGREVGVELGRRDGRKKEEGYAVGREEGWG